MVLALLQMSGSDFSSSLRALTHKKLLVGNEDVESRKIFAVRIT